jgi:6-phosphofructokinase 1
MIIFARPNSVLPSVSKTARHIGAQIIQNLMEDAETANRWKFVVAMGRHAGHLAVGIGKAAAATRQLCVKAENNGEKIRSKKSLNFLGQYPTSGKGRPNGVVVIVKG